MLRCGVLLMLVVLVNPATSLAWNDKRTHYDLSGMAAEHSVLSAKRGGYLGRLGLASHLGEVLSSDGNSWIVKEWIAFGGVEEDAGTVFTAHYYNHFHNPLKSWGQAGLSTIYPFINGQSSLLWAQDSANPWPWQKARESFYSALVSSTDAGRSEGFARTFRGLGHLIHLIQDAAQPAHVRNDPHPLDDMGVVPQFENWARSPANQTFLASLMTTPVFPSVSLNVSAVPGYVPITQFWDTDQYGGANPTGGTGTGISEYTQANFFSEDTINVSAYPFPRITPATPVVLRNILAPDGTTYKREYWLKDCCGETNSGQGQSAAATAIVSVHSKDQMDVLLKGKWEEAWTALLGGDIERVMLFFEENAQALYRPQFKALCPVLGEIASDMSNILLDEIRDGAAKYAIISTRDGVTHAHILFLAKDGNGIWKIWRF